MVKKYLSLEKLTEYDALLKAQISEGDEAVKLYVDTQISNLTTDTAIDEKISDHNESSTAHNDIRDLISALSIKVNNFLNVDDTTTDELSEILDLINNNKGTLESLTSSKINVSDIVDNLTTANGSKVLSANQGVILKGLIDNLQAAVDGKAAATHTHTISDVSGLQSTLDEKATIEALTNAINDAKEDAANQDVVVLSEAQKHIDVVQTNLDTHITDTVKHITSVERTNWDEAYTHAQSIHAPLDAQANVIESIKVNGVAQTITNKAVDIIVPTITVDEALNSSSTNPVQNKVVSNAFSTLTSAVSANTSSISSHSTSIQNLQIAVDEIQEITSEEIQSLFNNKIMG